MKQRFQYLYRISLLNKHYRLFKRGKTGNLPPPSFISLNQSGQVETLVKEKQAQAEKLNAVEAERERLREAVKRLEDEKAKHRGQQPLQREERNPADRLVLDNAVAVQLGGVSAGELVVLLDNRTLALVEVV